MRGGVYNYSASQSTGVFHGSAANRITITSAANEWAILDFNTSPAATDGLWIDGNFWEVKNLEIRKSKGKGLGVAGANAIVSGCTVRDCFLSGIWLIGNGHTVTGNSVFNNCRTNEARLAGAGWPAGIDLYRTTLTTVSYNDVYENWGEGVLAQQSSGVSFSNNEVWDNFSVNIYLDGCKDSTVQYNVSTSYWNASFFRDSEPAEGIVMAREQNGATFHHLNNITIKYNVVSNAREGIKYSDYGAGQGLRNSSILNNNVQFCVYNVINIEADNSTTNVQVRNNTWGNQWSGWGMHGPNLSTTFLRSGNKLHTGVTNNSRYGVAQ